ncbi:MAG: flagellar motor protein PomA [Gammaproteobacteria bacterium]|nr:MAG: flagellar motor protein PomA [Gammaproteobacteria bacterium]
MDLATLIGLVGAILLIGTSILIGASPVVFLNLPSLLIVFGGSLFVVLAKFSVHQFLGAMRVAVHAFKFSLPTIEELIDEVIEIASVFRKDGALALEDREMSTDFLGAGVRLLVDGQSQELVRGILEKERLQSLERHRLGARIFSSLGDVSPAMGMIGTLIGLVQMLSNMEDPKSIGPAMAVALLTTLYGAMLSTMVFQPIADKLSLRMNEEAQMQALLIDAVGEIQQGTNPRVIQQLLGSYLPGGKRESAEQPGA